jgi:hypothetical protein
MATIFEVNPKRLLKKRENTKYQFISDKFGIGAGGSEKNWKGSEYAVAFFTDERILAVAAGDDDDYFISIPYDRITEAEYKGQGAGAFVSVLHSQRQIIVDFEGKNGQKRVHIWNEESRSQNKNATKFLTEIAGSSSDSELLSGKCREFTENAGDKYPSEINTKMSKIMDDDAGNYVTVDRVEKVEDILDRDEKVVYLTRGSTVDVEGSSAGDSLFGDDRSRKSGTRGWVRAAITDKRIAIKVPQWLGDDERSVPYQNITSVDLDTGLVNKRISLQTPGQTYHIEAQEPGKQEVRDAVKYIREKITESQEDQVIVQGSDEPDPTEQLQNLKQLHDQGVLTNEEFEDKKQSLLDKI